MTTDATKLLAAANRIESLAFAMPAPNTFTPQFVEIAIELRALATAQPEATLKNPWTGEPRDMRDVESDPSAILCPEPGVPLMAATAQPAEAVEGCRCQSCGRPYAGDMLVPDEVWAKVAGGERLLCASCLLARIVDAGIWSAARATSVDAAQGDGEDKYFWKFREQDGGYSQWYSCSEEEYNRKKDQPDIKVWRAP